ncbi:iron-siderophore ABC transporter substrate-binding protein [Actinomycetospora termitidis]|uniref:Iron-siderophore ABC transporter substrate-binding protein n=1 Tax=Actinomycetospora termitidis TaxID=3053470 RepID=A0ABT7MHX8_9PSEU|nr:iron-siderophore ABC transporter substrate-binding protein [Actinomycetospora sp. Odt1-22]MDL5159537.1 iron-siderophore ABC transporter substrate-binding protein [Actinomycetospora sp. Odt1-22]
MTYRPTRRSVLAGAGGLAALAALAACGDSGGGTAGPTNADGPSRQIQGAGGPVTIPANPQRIACVDFYTTYALLDVGVTPVATAQATVGGVYAPYQQAYDAIPKVGQPTSVNVEAIAAATPDLILGTKVPTMQPGLEQNLQAIAPTVMFDSGSEPGTWKQRALATADAVNKLAAGQQVAGEYDQHAARIKQQFAATLGRTTWGLVRGSSGGAFFADYPTSWSGVVLADAGMRFGAATAGKRGAGQRLSFEQAAQLADCDVLLYLADTTGQVEPNTQALLAQPAFQQLPAVRAGRAFPLPNYYATHYRQGDAVLTTLEQLLPRL